MAYILYTVLFTWQHVLFCGRNVWMVAKLNLNASLTLQIETNVHSMLHVWMVVNVKTRLVLSLATVLRDIMATNANKVQSQCRKWNEWTAVLWLCLLACLKWISICERYCNIVAHFHKFNVSKVTKLHLIYQLKHLYNYECIQYFSNVVPVVLGSYIVIFADSYIVRFKMKWNQRVLVCYFCCWHVFIKLAKTRGDI